MSYRDQFPDFDDISALAMGLDTLGFRDCSWRDDACPCFIKGRMIVWVDYLDASQREVNGFGTRFAVFPLDFEGCVTDEPELYAGDDPTALLEWLEAYDHG